MNIKNTRLKGVLIIEPLVYADERGFFKETFQVDRYREIGIDLDFVQDNLSRSHKDVIRGLHFQKKRPQGKLVNCLQGAVWDVVVDIDPNSPTFGEYVGIELNDSNHLQLWVPPGYAHGFCVLSEAAYFQYKCTDYYDPSDEGGIRWNDPELGISWPTSTPIISVSDMKLKSLRADELEN